MSLEFDILRAIKDMNEGATVAAVKEAAKCRSTSALYRAISELEDSGFIEPRKRHEHRAIRISLAGKAAVRSARLSGRSRHRG